MKKLTSLILALVLCLSLTIPAFAADTQSKGTAIKKGVQVLLNSGWTQTEIEDIVPDDALLQLAKCSPAISSDTKYYRVTENGANVISESNCIKQVKNIRRAQNSVLRVKGVWNDSVVTSNGLLQYSVEAYPCRDNGNYILSAHYKWLRTPATLSKDVFGLGHSDVLTQTTKSKDVVYQFKADQYDVTSGKVYAGTYSIRKHPETRVKQGGTAIIQNLNDACRDTPYVCYPENIRGFMQYNVKVNNYAATVASISADYHHQKYKLNITPSISYPAGCGISLSSSSKFDQMLPNPYCSFDV